MKKKAPISSAKTKTSTRKKGSSNKSTGRRIFFFLLKTGIALLLLGFLLFLIVYVGFTGPVPSSEELQKISGIGSVIADAIINYRTDNGLYYTLESLMDVQGIGNSKFTQIKNYVILHE